MQCAATTFPFGTALRNALDQRQLRDENRSLKKAVEVRHQMIGESAALRQVMTAVSRAAPTHATRATMKEASTSAFIA